MKPSLLEYFAAHEQLSDLDTAPDGSVAAVIQALMPENPPPAGGRKCLTWEATWRARLRFIRAREMVIESMIQNPPIESPAPKTTGLSFSEALVAMKEGKRVKRAAWDDSRAMKILNDGTCCDVNDQLIVAEWSDILAEDWMGVP